MDDKYTQLENEVKELRKLVEDMQQYNLMSPEFKRSISLLAELTASAKSATSENQSVNEAGSGSYSVLGIPDGFDQRDDGGTTKYYAYWT